MKKLFLMIFSVLLLVGCNAKGNETTPEIPVMDNYTVTASAASNNYSDCQNDLVYHDYGTGVKLTKNSILCLPQLDLKLTGDTAHIYVVNLDNNEVLKLYSYEPLQDVTYSPASDGVYQILAAVSNGEIIDLTPEATIEISSGEENMNGLILLN